MRIHALVLSLVAAVALFGCDSGSSFSGNSIKKKAPAKPEQTLPANPLGEETDSGPADDVVQPEISDTPDVDLSDEGQVEEEDDVVEIPESDAPEDAIVAGSFKAWTVPADPTPGEDYKIMIEVSLPSNVASYTKEDLSGSVIGTDGYSQQIANSAIQDPDFGSFIGLNREEFQFFGNRAILGVTVPGALNLVEDTIQIRSTILNENQTLKIVF